MAAVAECRSEVLDGTIAQYFFDPVCVANRRLVGGIQCPEDQVNAFLAAFAGENKMHVQMFNLLVLFVVVAAAQLGGVPKPIGGVPKLAYILWITMTSFQWIVALLSFVSLSLSYERMHQDFGACLRPVDPTLPTGFTLLDVISVLTFVFQPVFVSRFVLLVMQPIAIVSGVRGVTRVAKRAGPFTSAMSQAALAFFSVYLSLLVVVSAIAFPLTLIAWIGSLSVVFSAIYVPLLATSLFTAMATLVLINGITAFVRFMALWTLSRDKRREDRKREKELETREEKRKIRMSRFSKRSSASASGAVAGAPAADTDAAEDAALAYSDEDEDEAAGRVGFGDGTPALGTARRGDEGAPTASVTTRVFAYADKFFTFSFYWCEWQELRQVTEILRVRSLIWVIFRHIALFFLAPLRVVILLGSLPIVAVLVCMGERKPCQLLKAPACWKDTWVYFSRSQPPAALAEVRVDDADGAPDARNTSASGASAAVSSGATKQGGGVAADRAAIAHSIAEKRQQLSQIINHPFASVFTMALLIQIVAPLIVYGVWTSTFLYGTRPPLAAWIQFVEDVYDFAYEGFLEFRIPALDLAIWTNLDVRAFLAQMPNWRELTTQQQISGSEALGAVSVILGVLKPLTFFLMGFHSICINCKLRQNLDVVPLGVTSRMAAAVDPREFQKETLDLSQRVFSSHEIEAMVENELRDNHNVKVLVLSGTELGEEGFVALSSALPSMELRTLDFGHQPIFRQEDASVVANAAVQVPSLEQLRVNGFALSMPPVRKGAPAAAQKLVETDNHGVGPAAAKLIYIFAYHKRLVVDALKLRRAPLGDEGAKNIASALPSIGATLTVLELQECNIGHAGARDLGAFLPVAAALERLDVSGNDLSKGESAGPGAQLLMGGLGKLSKLSTLVARGCNMGPDAARAVTPLPALTTLDLSNNPLGEEGVAALAEALQGMSHLRDLRLARTAAGKQGFAAIGEALPRMTALTALDLSRSKPQAEGTAVLVAALPKQFKLERLDISDASLTDADAIALRDALEWISATPPNCQTFALQVADFGLLPTQHLPVGHLKVLLLYPNGFSDVGVHALADGLRINSSVTKLKISPDELDVAAFKKDAELQLVGAKAIARHVDAIVLTELIKGNHSLRYLTVELKADTDRRKQTTNLIIEVWAKYKDLMGNGLTMKGMQESVGKIFTARAQAQEERRKSTPGPGQAVMQGLASLGGFLGLQAVQGGLRRASNAFGRKPSNKGAGAAGAAGPAASVVGTLPAPRRRLFFQRDTTSVATRQLARATSRAQLSPGASHAAIDYSSPAAAAAAAAAARQDTLPDNVHDTTQDPDFNRDVDQSPALKCRTLMAVTVFAPRRDEGAAGEPDLTRPLAIIEVRNRIANVNIDKYMRSAGTFRSSDVDFLHEFARQSASAFEQALAMERAREEEQYHGAAEACANAVHDLAILGTRADFQIEKYFPRVVDACVKLLRGDRATVFLVEGDRLISKASEGLPEISVPLKQNSVASWVVQNLRPVLIADAYKDPRFDPTVDKKTNYRTRHVLCVPIVDPASSAVIGCLQVLNKRDVDNKVTPHATFTERDVEYAEAFALVTAVNIMHTGLDVDASTQGTASSKLVHQAAVAELAEAGLA